MKLTLTVKGTRPLITHNIRLANPLDPHTRRLGELIHQKKKTDELIVKIMLAEQRAGYYETEDGLVALPTENVFASLLEAARTLKLGRQLEKALRFNGEAMSPLKIDGRTCKPDDHMKLDQSLYYVPVGNKGNRVMRARPKMDVWESTHTFELDEGLLNQNELKQIAEIAGRDIGLCERRPRFGTFDAVITNGKVARR